MPTGDQLAVAQDISLLLKSSASGLGLLLPLKKTSVVS